MTGRLFARAAAGLAMLAAAGLLAACGSSGPSDPGDRAQWERLGLVIDETRKLVKQEPDIGATINPLIAEAEEVHDDVSLDVSDYVQASCGLYYAVYAVSDQAWYDDIECEVSSD